MKKTLKLLSVLLLALSLFTACNQAGNDGLQRPAENYTGGVGESDAANTDVAFDNENQKIIKTVDATLQTDAYDSVIDGIEEAVVACGGYISNANYSGNSYYEKDATRKARLTVRIPAEKLSDFTHAVGELALVSYYNENIQDVTLAYVDITSRISVLEAQEASLTSMLEVADSISNMLQIRDQLTNVQQELASLRAQKNVYDSKISYSTVNLTVNEVERVNAAADDTTFFGEVGAKFSDSLYSIGNGFRSFAVWLLGNILYILLFGVLIGGAIIIIHLINKKTKESKSPRKTFHYNMGNSKNNDKQN